MALLSIVLGLAFLVDPASQMGTLAPLALFALGLAILSGVVAFQHRDNSPPQDRVPLPPSIVATSQALLESPTRDVSAGTRLDGPAATAAGSEWRILSAPPDPGDETWLSWLPRERRRLGPAAGSPGPGVVASPGKAGNLVAFPVRNYFGAIPFPVRASAGSSVTAGKVSHPNYRDAGGRVASVPPSEVPEGTDEDDSFRGAPFSVEELDRMFPPVSGRRPVFLTEAPQKVGGPSFVARDTGSPAAQNDWTDEQVEPEPSTAVPTSGLADGSTGLVADEGPTVGLVARSPRMGVTPRGGPSAEDPGREARWKELSLEAANPVPPHLRAVGPIDRSVGALHSRGSHGPPGPRSVCASCSKVVVNLRMSGPCPRCLRPVCDDCLREAFVTAGFGWCRDCSRAAPAAT